MRYEVPETKGEAVSLLAMAEGGGRVLAGEPTCWFSYARGW